MFTNGRDDSNIISRSSAIRPAPVQRAFTRFDLRPLNILLALQLLLAFDTFGDAALIDETTENDTPKCENCYRKPWFNDVEPSGDQSATVMLGVQTQLSQYATRAAR